MSLLVATTAMGVSMVTTYFTLFDQRYTLTAAMSKASIHRQSGSSSSEGRVSASYRFFPTIEFVLSNRGSRPLVLTEAGIVRSDNLETCEGEGEIRRPFRDEPGTVVMEPDTVRVVSFETNLPAIDVEDTGAGFDVKADEALWCVALTVFDHNGERLTPLFPAFTTKMDFRPPSEDERVPEMIFESETKYGARIVSSSGAF